MSKSTLQQLAEFGQSVWLDYINRPMLENGDLQKRIDNGLRGMTSNPSIFNAAIGSTNDYDAEITKLKTKGKSAFAIYDELTIRDIQDAADIFKPVYEKTKRLDGYVSLEINPLLANKVKESIKEGERLFKKVNRPNCMIKVPATDEGYAIVEELIAKGINVNVTLIFSKWQYEQTVKAYWDGLTRLSQKGGDLSRARSVASVFISRVDSAVDKILDDKIASEKDRARIETLKSLYGKAAVANSRTIFEKFRQLHASDNFKGLQAKGANVQRVLWGSTSTKNPKYSDIKYVTELIAQPTVNTIPEKTLNAFIDHGEVKDAFIEDAAESFKTIDTLKTFDIDINDVCAQLLQEGCQAFDQAFAELLATIEKKAESLVTP